MSESTPAQSQTTVDPFEGKTREEIIAAFIDQGRALAELNRWHGALRGFLMSFHSDQVRGAGVMANWQDRAAALLTKEMDSAERFRHG